MARGRMITHLICKDKKVASLSDDTCRLLFTWLVTVCDCEGRTYGDPDLVLATIFPRRHDISVEKIDAYLEEIRLAGLIVRYTVDEEQYIWFPSFEKNQIGLRKDREAPSEIPIPPAELLRTNSGTTPEQLPVKLIEVNRIEENGIEINIMDGEIGALSTAFEQEAKIMVYKPKEWVEALRTMWNAGITPDGLIATIQAMRHPTGKNQQALTITGPWSCVKTAIGRNASSNGGTYGI